MIRYGEICSGINAPTQAWHALGWRPEFFSEIDAFPSAVSAHRWAGVPNHGDFTTIKKGDYDKIDLLVGGTPCQSFSVAGSRGGLDDERGNLTLEFARLAYRLLPRWFVWENVPGVFSLDGGSAFGAVIAKFAGYPTGHVFECPDGGWRNFGIVKPCTPEHYGLAWRVLDAQYIRVESHAYAVPQRRRRVFVVGYLGDWRRAAAVLFEPEGLRGDIAPRREAGQGVATTVSARPSGGGGLGTDFDCDGGLVANALNGKATGRFDATVETFVSHALKGEGFDASEDGTGRGTPLAPVAFDCKGTEVQFCDDGSHPTLRSMGHHDSHQNAGGHAAVAFAENSRAEVRLMGGDGGSSKSYVSEGYAVRRLTPLECERLQGFPADYTRIPWRGKGAEFCPDGPRYKALGNSMAVNVMRWIGERIDILEGEMKTAGARKAS